MPCYTFVKPLKYKKMKRIIVIAMAVFAGQLLMAQQTAPETTTPAASEANMRRHHKRGNDEMKTMMKELNLSEEQKAKMADMRAANKTKRTAIQNDSKLTEAQKKQEMKAALQQQQNEMDALLNEEQKVKMNEMRSKMKAETKAGWKGKNRSLQPKVAAPAPTQQ
jgi:hypothetical protein